MGADVRFFLGNSGHPLVHPDEVFLSVDDGYKGLPAKTQAIGRHALQQSYEWLFSTDDDSYVQIERLLKSVPRGL